MRFAIEAVCPAEITALRGSLTALLQDAVDSGASLGFLPPLGQAEASSYWDEMAAALGDGSCVLLVARDGAGAVLGSAQLELARRANGRHRAEVSKVMVHRAARRQGIGRALMRAVEAEARRRGRTTLFLDTRQGDPSEQLYRQAGWTLAGAIPRFARSGNGALDATAIYYKLLDPADRAAPVPPTVRADGSEMAR